jgi:hypothetical protein
MSENGKLPASELAPIAQGQLRIDAAAAWNALNVESRRRGLELVPTGSMSSYRTYSQQVYLWEEYQAGRGALAAVPGTSNHGWGTAVDTPDQRHWSMIEQIGAPYGYSKAWSDAPSEPWHVVYQPGHYTGPDPGPYGIPAIPELPEDTVSLFVILNKDGRVEVFVEQSDGEVWHAWQKSAGGAFEGAQTGVRNATWFTLGTPGK